MGGDPYFGKLPPELLGKIATALPLDEATRTSILSRRWRSQWRSALPNPHFAGNPTTQFAPNGYPISCFDTVDEFLNWVDKVIIRGTAAELSIESLGLNFEPEDTHCGWIEFNYKTDGSNTAAALVDGACTCCRFKVVSFRRPDRVLSLSGLLSGRRRGELLKRLALRNCDMGILRSQLTGAGNSFQFLISLVVQKGRFIEARFLSCFIYGCPVLQEVTLEDCCIVDNYEYGDEDGTVLRPCSGGRLMIVRESLMLLRLTRCSGFAEVVYVSRKRKNDYRPTIQDDTIEFDFSDFEPIPTSDVALLTFSWQLG
ncbi:unnamed protein product [Linum trigynum]|uniref:F-box domain-containing protein n=1 Tax=Linum trigynum TaxID=586398 RepID=A0AAV2GVR4_9ROSI